ncbi:MBOAT family protein [Ignatzschineria rhizosphaerae]|uniref:Probable alginate O-acetylase n=1 Tax=Ignatzschineria rhizosphaerae TaxID=2923279 RepID=A0ABY3X675_9GAMM|nr:MBOAT family O-acyltransferase [Ignatzschineria rhizosphaerae]UNM96532.1 MBOAT family protein [Ignatzschineria rhizosphaerae]
MSYLSIEFAAIFVAFFLIYWIFRSRVAIQNLILLISSYLIVGLFNINFALILGSYSVILYLLSTGIVYSLRPKLWLIISVVAAIGNLAVFKYFNFFAPQLQHQFAEWGIELSLPVAEIILPIGISFYTFHSMSYLVSIYERAIDKRNSELTKENWRGMEPVSFFDFALFLSFFPSIIAGPINRAKSFLPQLQNPKPREVLEPHRAFMLIILAVIKVYWLSSFFSQAFVKPVFDNPTEYHTVELILAIYAYAIEIYLNFSGYTDLVTGIALLLGFKLPINFNAPYLATSLKEFWTRWHISLSTWIRDYIYFPLGGNRKGFSRTQINVMIGMVLSGLWHGETLNFLIWGALHGIGVVLLNIKDQFKERRLLHRGLSKGRVRDIMRREVTGWRKYLGRFITFNYVGIGWLFFRSETFDDSMAYITSLFHNYGNIAENLEPLGILAGLIVVIFAIYPLLTKLPEIFINLTKKIPFVLLPLLFVAILWGVIYLAPSGIPQFIYASF